MNILFLHDRPSGGAGESLLQLVQSLKQEHRCCIVFTTEGFLKPKFDAIQNEIPQYYYPTAGSWLLNRDFNFAFLNYARFAIKFPKYIPLIREIMRRAKQHNTQVIYSNTMYLMEGAIAAKLLGIPHFWQVRELFDLDHYRYSIPKKNLTKFLGWFSKAVIVNSNRTKQSIERFKGNLQKVKVIHNIINSPAKNWDIKTKLGLKPADKTVCILGWIIPIKRVEDFIEVANQFSEPDIKFLIIGDFGSKTAYNDKIRSLIEQSPNKHNIIHTGIITNAVNYLASIDVLISACYMESFGRTVGEALIAGTPAIGVRGSATQELIQDGVSGFIVDKSDTSAMATHLKELLNNDILRKEMGTNGKHFILQNFSTNAILPLYKQLLKTS